MIFGENKPRYQPGRVTLLFWGFHPPGLFSPDEGRVTNWYELSLGQVPSGPDGQLTLPQATEQEQGESFFKNILQTSFNFF